MVLGSSDMILFVQNEQHVNCTWLQDACHEIWNDANGQLWLGAGGLLHLTLHCRCLFAASAPSAGSRVEGKREWESTQVGTVPVHALLPLPRCFPSLMSLAITSEQWLWKHWISTSVEIEFGDRIEKEWLIHLCWIWFEISRLVVQQAGLLRGGVAEQRMELVIKENVAAIIRSGQLVNWIIWHIKSMDL